MGVVASSRQEGYHDTSYARMSLVWCVWGAKRKRAHPITAHVMTVWYSLCHFLAATVSLQQNRGGRRASIPLNVRFSNDVDAVRALWLNERIL
jgi:hypothetical protein